jgi:hypothetical protein
MEFGEGSQVNVPIAILIWLMIFPMMLKIDFGSLSNVAKKPKGLLVTLFVNWLVKPFSMAFLAWLFFQYIFAAWLIRKRPKVTPPASLSCSSSLHSYGFCLVLSNRRRSGIHTGSGNRE